jgi:hypothetical protein
MPKKIQEKQWGDTDNKKTWDQSRFEKLLAKQGSTSDFQKHRHAQQPNLFNIYLKHGAGDYRGRSDRFNTVAIKNVIRPASDEEVDKEIKKIKRREKKMLSYKKDPRRKYKQASSGEKPGDDTGADEYAMFLGGGEVGGDGAMAMGESDLIREKEWDETENRKEFESKRFRDLIGDLDGEEEFNDLRHDHQPSVYGLSFRSRGGDYKGRTNMRNTKSDVYWGISKLDDAIKRLKRRAKDIESDKGYDKTYGKFISLRNTDEKSVKHENFGFADFVEKVKRRRELRRLNEVPRCPEGYKW